MDFRRPVQSVIPGVQGRILAVLAEPTVDLNLRTIARLAGVSAAQASRVLAELVRLGLVERREAPPSALFRLVEENVAARAVCSLSRARVTVLDELGGLVEGLPVPPVSVIVFGSFARGEAGPDSDLDVVFVRPERIGDDDDRWAASVDGWRVRARRMTGNRVEVLEAEEGATSRFLRGGRPLWKDIASEGVVVYGASIDELRGRRSA